MGLVRRCVDDYNMISEGDKIAVGVSGGKDSLTLLFALAELACTVIGIALLLCSAHRNKGEHNIPENKSDTYEGTLATDVQHAREKRHQHARNEERIRQNLDVDCCTLREKSF